MELIKKNIHMDHCQELAYTQISLEEDQNISDQKPDALRVICKKADVRIAETKVSDDSVLIKGTLEYQVLYLTDEAEKRLCGMSGEIPFEEKIYTNKSCIYDEVRVAARAEDVTIRLINSRKINIRCIVAASVLCDALYDEEVVTDVENPAACEILKKTLAVTSIALDTRDIFRIKDEFSVPDGYPNIYALLWKNIRFDGLEFVPMDGRIGIRGEWTAFFIYEGEEEESEPRCFEMSRTIDGYLEVPECRDNMILRVDWEPEQEQVEVRTDYDGEERLIGLDMELKLFIKLYGNEELSVVVDAYGLQEMLEPVMKEGTYRHIIKNDCGKIKLSDTCDNSGEAEQITHILHADACIVDEKNAVTENEISMMGVVHMELLCKTEEPNEPYRCIVLDLPYKQIVSVMQLTKDSPYCVKMCIEQVHAGIQGDKIEVRVLLDYCLIAYCQTVEPMLVGMEKVTENGQDKSLPVMSVYFAKENEALWNIGKKYRVSLNDIKEINQINADVLNGGERILIAKEML
ncbi:MAG: DUF3794 domain-containing protein [Lachnospiraceae bacterium]|nr:DUF3794 domain-containing protein [Lachnospiraceae bacterium]